jgi:hypothetical protein
MMNNSQFSLSFSTCADELLSKFDCNFTLRRYVTDDLKGFRRYARIRETLIHELTHNVWSAHDINFKRLCSQVRNNA